MTCYIYRVHLPAVLFYFPGINESGESGTLEKILRSIWYIHIYSLFPKVRDVLKKRVTLAVESLGRLGVGGNRGREFVTSIAGGTGGGDLKSQRGGRRASPSNCISHSPGRHLSKSPEIPVSFEERGRRQSESPSRDRRKDGGERKQILHGRGFVEV